MLTPRSSNSYSLTCTDRIYTDDLYKYFRRQTSRVRNCMSGLGVFTPGLLSWIASIAARQVLVGRYSVLAVIVVQILEWLSCLEVEYELIYCARWTWVKAAYYTCRYYPLIITPFFAYAWLSDISQEVCEKVVHPLYALIIPCLLSPQAVILFRAYAFAGRSRLLLYLFSTCFLALLVADVWLFGTQFVAIKDLYLVLGPSGCFGNDKSAETNLNFQYINAWHTGVVMLATFVLDLIATAAVIVHCFRIRSTQGPLGETFLKQGLLAFVIMSALNLLCASVYFSANRQNDGIGLPFAFGLPGIISCRLILLLRRRVTPTETFELREQSRVVREGLRAYHSMNNAFSVPGGEFIPHSGNVRDDQSLLVALNRMTDDSPTTDSFGGVEEGTTSSEHYRRNRNVQNHSNNSSSTIWTTPSTSRNIRTLDV